MQGPAAHNGVLAHAEHEPLIPVHKAGQFVRRIFVTLLQLHQLPTHAEVPEFYLKIFTIFFILNLILFLFSNFGLFIKLF